VLITKTEFIGSYTDVYKCPKELLPEYAFIGRSNVGKSSLINMLCQNKKLARISSTPGKTQLINYFKINNKWFLIDLPGYGYAKTSKEKKKQFQKYIEEYFTKRKQIICAFLLIDVRLSPQEIDLNFMSWLNQNIIPFVIVFTKADKLKEKSIENNIEEYIKTLKKYWEKIPEYFITSSVKKKGKEKILDHIGNLCYKYSFKKNLKN